VDFGTLDSRLLTILMRWVVTRYLHARTGPHSRWIWRRSTSAWVCLSLVTDPFGDYDEAYLRQCFPDVVIEFKQHFIVDSRTPARVVRARASLAQRPPSTCKMQIENVLSRSSFSQIG